MKKIAEIKAPKAIVDFIVHQSTSFIASKEFKKRVMDFLFNVVDDVFGREAFKREQCDYRCQPQKQQVQVCHKAVSSGVAHAYASS